MLLQDLRYTLRMLRRAPLFTLTVVITLTLGIGATTTIFSVVNAVILTPLPFGAPNRLIWIAERNDRLNLDRFSASSANYLSWKPRARAFEEMAAFGFGSYNLGGDGGEPEQVSGAPITPSVLPVLGLGPVLGRDFRAGDDIAGAPRVVLIGEGLWQRRFGGDPHVVGRHISVNSTDAEIVGVAPAALTLISPGDIWTPLNATADPRHLNHVVVAIGRLRPGVNLTQAQSDMDAVARGLGAEVPEVAFFALSAMVLKFGTIGHNYALGLCLSVAAVTAASTALNTNRVHWHFAAGGLAGAAVATSLLLCVVPPILAIWLV